MKSLAAGASGIVFGAGLTVAGMTNPAKVLGFLDVFGAWDPTLAFVMGAALAVYAAGYQISRRMQHSLLGDEFGILTLRDLDPSLIGGAALFGVGWGLVGLCPGPALAGLASGRSELLIFAGAMVAGAVAFRFTAYRLVHKSAGS